MSVLNGERFLREAVESILSQTFRDFEFIIIDDGSTDGTASMLDSFQRSDPRARVYRQRNAGMAESWNRGCRLAQGKYIARMDADDVSLPDRFERQIGHLESHEEVGLLGGDVEGIDDAGRAIPIDSRPLDDESIRANLRSMKIPICHPTVMMRKQAFDATGGYRPQFAPAEDYDFLLRISEGWRVENLPGALLRKRVHPKEISVEQVRQLALSLLGAHALSIARERHSAEPRCQAGLISEEFLEELGVSHTLRRETLVGLYSYWIACMARASQPEAALRLLRELVGLSTSGHVNRTRLSEAMLLAAKIHYRQRRPVEALASLGRAILIRPRLAGRPLRLAASWLFTPARAPDNAKEPRLSIPKAL